MSVSPHDQSPLQSLSICFILYNKLQDVYELQFYAVIILAVILPKNLGKISLWRFCFILDSQADSVSFSLAETQYRIKNYEMDFSIIGS